MGMEEVPQRRPEDRELSIEETEAMAYASNAIRSSAAEAREKAKNADPESQYNGPSSYERNAEILDGIAERKEMFALVQSKVAEMDIRNITTEELQAMLAILEKTQ